MHEIRPKYMEAWCDMHLDMELVSLRSVDSVVTRQTPLSKTLLSNTPVSIRLQVALAEAKKDMGKGAFLQL